jgi:nitrile hydratase
MNGAQDLGGMQSFGPVVPEPNEPPFHHDWERRAFAITLAMGATGAWNLDQSRAARESLAPAEYLTKTYYEIWLAGLEKLLVQKDLVGADEIEAGRALRPAAPVRRVLAPQDVTTALKKGAPTERRAAGPARFAVGDAVIARNMHPPTHTRIPRYVRGRRGVIAHVHGPHVFADTNALGLGEDPQWLYGVRFAGTELWGAGTDPDLSVHVDLWEPYLEPAPR